MNIDSPLHIARPRHCLCTTAERSPVHRVAAHSVVDHGIVHLAARSAVAAAGRTPGEASQSRNLLVQPRTPLLLEWFLGTGRGPWPHQSCD